MFMPWTIWPALVVLWGVCWMFYDSVNGHQPNPFTNFDDPVWPNTGSSSDTSLLEFWDAAPTPIVLSNIGLPSTGMLGLEMSEATATPYVDVDQMAMFGFGQQDITAVGPLSPNTSAKYLAVRGATTTDGVSDTDAPRRHDDNSVNTAVGGTSSLEDHLVAGTSREQALGRASEQSFGGAAASRPAGAQSEGRPKPNKADKRWYCPDCHLSFSRNADLARHTRTHHGQKFIFCPMSTCKHAVGGKYGFARSDHLSQHWRKMHAHVEMPSAECQAASGYPSQISEMVNPEALASNTDSIQSRKRMRLTETTNVCTEEVADLTEENKRLRQTVLDQDQRIQRLERMVDRLLESSSS